MIQRAKPHFAVTYKTGVPEHQRQMNQGVCDEQTLERHNGASGAARANAT
jgi:hypothetical protein